MYLKKSHFFIIQHSGFTNAATLRKCYMSCLLNPPSCLWQNTIVIILATNLTNKTCPCLMEWRHRQWLFVKLKGNILTQKLIFNKSPSQISHVTDLTEEKRLICSFFDEGDYWNLYVLSKYKPKDNIRNICPLHPPILPILSLLYSIVSKTNIHKTLYTDGVCHNNYDISHHCPKPVYLWRH